MVASLAACGEGGNKGPATITATPTPAAEIVVTNTPTPTPVPSKAPVFVKKTPSIDFEDGNYGFATVYKGSGKADESKMELAEVDGNKVVKVSNVKANLETYVAFDVYALLGDKAADVAAIEVTLWGNDADGNYNASAGNLIGRFSVANEDGKTEVVDEKDVWYWTPYLDRDGSRVFSYEVPEGKTFDSNEDIFMVLLNENAAAKDKKGGVEGNAVLFIDDVTFLDKAGNTIPVADTTVAFVGPAVEDAPDFSGLYLVKNPVNFEGFVTSGSAWGQNGIELTDEFDAALVPGSVIEISYSSESGDIWVLFPWADGGWRRCAQGSMYKNGSKNVAQVTYEQLVAVYGDDKTKWGKMFQCESDTAWDVYSVKVGQKADMPILTGAISIPDFVTSGGGWGQNGFEITSDIFDAIVPGTALEVTFSSEDNTIWILFPWAEGGWRRCAQGEALIVGDKAYITYDQLVAVYGEDKTKWGAMLQCEAQTAWEVYGIKVGKLGAIPAANKVVNIPDFVTSGSAWGQNGFEITSEIFDAIVPGTYIRVKFSSEDNTLWILFPWAEGGWRRCAQGEAIIDNGYAYISYDQLVAVYGEDKTKWGAMLQCEAQTAWEVYAVDVISAVE